MNFVYKTVVVAATVLAATSCIQDEALNTECDILTCSLPAEVVMSDPKITNDRVTVNVQPEADISALAPVFTLTEGATISPASGSVQDFLNADDHTVNYTVTSQDGEWHKTYRVQVVQQLKPDEYRFNKVELDPTKKYSIFNEYDENGNFLMAWSSGNPGYVMCGEANKAARAAYGKDNYKDHIWEFFPTLAVFPEGTTMKTDNDNVTSFVNGGKYAQPEYIRLVTRSTGGFGAQVKMPIAAGNIFQGEFDLGSAVSQPREATRFGEPYNYKPVKLSGEYRFKAGDVFTDGKGNVVVGRKDIFSIYAIFFESDDDVKFIDSNVHYNDFMHPNMVALANLTDAHETGLGDDDWVKFEIEFDYDKYKKAVNADLLAKGVYRLGIVIASSAEGDYFRGAVGSTLDVRNIKVTNE
ncbi:MAG: hypothetical protein EGQ99_06615 [Porphyromonadaceae bacterium]|nr:hypothetical protein [Porphyromonadaceae bacterium]